MGSLEVFGAELTNLRRRRVKMAQLTGSPIQTKPSWNFMIGQFSP